MDCHRFVNALYDNTLIIYYDELKNEAEKKIFDALRKSPYKNYTHSEYRTNKAEVLYLMVIAENEKADA